MSVQLNQQFLDWLNNTPEMLSKYLEIAKEWYAIQGEMPNVSATGDGPREFVIGGHVGVEVDGISHKDLDAIKQGYAEAQVKEKALEYIKGFVMAVSLVA